MDAWHRPQVIRRLAIAAVVVAGVVLVQRTVFQPYTPCDFAVVYVAARHWVAGENPYDTEQAMTTWLQADGRDDVIAEEVYEDFGKSWLDILLIPPSLPLFAPFALLPAPLATTLWWGVCAVLFLGAWLALTSLMGAKAGSPAALLLLAATLVLAPLHECFGWGQPSLPSISLIVLGIWCATKGHDEQAGVVLALATALKPQLGGFFAIYYLLCGRWRFGATFSLALLLLGAVAIMPMDARGTPWLASWLDHLHAAKAPGGMNSPSVENAARAHMLNLQVILHGLLENRTAVNLIALLITAALAGLFAWQRRQAASNDELLSLSVVSVLALLPVYHRLYDATLMIIPLAWAIMHLRHRPRVAIPVLIFVLSFIVPDRALYRAVQFLGGDMGSNTGLIWDALIEPHRVWVLIIGFVLLLRGMRKTAPQPSGAPMQLESPAPLRYSV